MKSMNIRKVGSILAGTAMMGAALAAPVMAGMDSSGINKGFFYDTSFSPIVKIVVGEKGMATDAVAAGNIAATIGNLAYMTKTVTPAGPSYTPEGQVVITTAARGATGDYVQDTEIPADIGPFYDQDEGLKFSDTEDKKTYEKGDFTTYTLSCDKQSRTEAGLLMDGTYNNVHCLFCQNLCLEGLENPSHDMKEKITIDSNKIRYYESGIGDDDVESLKMAIEKGAISYQVDTDFIPLKRISTADCTGDTKDCYIDFEYRGKIILFGDDSYYVKDVDGDKIYLAKAKTLNDITSEGFTSEYKGYKFKVDHLIYSAEFVVAGILLDVQKPDGSVVQVQVSKMANGVVDNLEISGVTAEEAASLQSASIIVYDLSSQVMLEDGKDLEIGGEVKKDWEVSFNRVSNCINAEVSDPDDADCDIAEYDDMKATIPNSLLRSIKVTYNADLDEDEALEKDEALLFPNNFKLTFKGYLTNDFDETPCSGAGEGNIKLERGDSPSELKVSFTGEDNSRYNEVRLDEGEFKKNELFIVNGVVYKYESYTKDSHDSGDTDDTVDVTLDPQIRGNKVKIKDMQRYCDPENEGDPDELTYTGQNCDAIGKIKIRKLALMDALKDTVQPDGSAKKNYENDEEMEIDSADLYIDADAVKGEDGTGLDLIFDESGNTIFFAVDFPTVPYLYVNANMVGDFDDFEVDGYNLHMKVVNEADLLNDPNSANYVAADDLNDDTDDDDTMVVFEVDDGNVVIDMSDRDFNDNDDTYYENDLALVDTTDVVIETLDEDTDTLLITPEGGDKFTIDWGSDNKIDAVDLCHPQDKVDSTYFIGTVEEQTTAESTLTKADEGKEVSAGCCTFTVKKFDVNVGNTTGQATTTAQVSAVPASMVVSETAAPTGNLVVVGGPSVNALCPEALRGEISAAADKFVVKKEGNMIFVAGWTADDTVAGGNALINWLKANVH